MFNFLSSVAVVFAGLVAVFYALSILGGEKKPASPSADAINAESGQGGTKGAA